MKKQLSLVAAVTFFAAAAAASAADYTWTGANGVDWTTATGNANWTTDGSTDIDWANGNNAVLNSSGGGSITLGSAIEAGTLNVSGGGTWTINSTNQSSTNINLTNTVISGSGTTLILNGTNDATGLIRESVTINAGATLKALTENALGWGGARVTAMTIDGGTFENASGKDANWGTAYTLKNGATINLSAAGSAWALGGGGNAVNIASDSVSTVKIIGVGDVKLRNGEGGSGPNVFNVARGTDASGVDFQVDVQIAGSAGLKKTGDGVMKLTKNNTFSGGLIVDGGELIISEKNTYSGDTTVDGGVLVLAKSADGQGLIRGAVTINNGGELRTTAGDTFGWDGGANAINTLTINEGGAFNNTSGTNQSVNAAITMQGGTIKGDRFDFVGGSTLTTRASATTSLISARFNLRVNDSVFDVAKGTVSDGVDLRITGVVSKDNPDGNGVLIKAGAGVMELAGRNTYFGGTTVQDGMIITGNDKALGDGDVTLSGGNLQIGNGTSNIVTLAAGKNVTTTAAATILLGGLDSQIILSGGGKYDFGGDAVTFDLMGVAFDDSKDYTIFFGGTGNVEALSYDFINGVAGYNYSFENGVLTATAVPEPSTYALLGGLAAAGVALVARRRKRG